MILFASRLSHFLSTGRLDLSNRKPPQAVLLRVVSLWKNETAPILGTRCVVPGTSARMTLSTSFLSITAMMPLPDSKTWLSPYGPYFSAVMTRSLPSLYWTFHSVVTQLLAGEGSLGPDGRALVREYQPCKTSARTSVGSQMNPIQPTQASTATTPRPRSHLVSHLRTEQVSENLVGRTRFELVTSSVSGKRSPAELTARVPRRDATRARTPPRVANGQADPCEPS